MEFIALVYPSHVPLGHRLPLHTAHKTSSRMGPKLLCILGSVCDITIDTEQLRKDPSTLPPTLIPTTPRLLSGMHLERRLALPPASTPHSPHTLRPRMNPVPPLTNLCSGLIPLFTKMEKALLVLTVLLRPISSTASHPGLTAAL